MKTPSPPTYTIWVPVISALGAALLTGLVAIGLNWVQHRLEKKSAAKKELSAAYGDLLASSFNFIQRAHLVRVIAQFRSGIEEGPSILLGLRPPLDVLKLFDWLFRDMERMNDAWSRIWASGSQEAINAADRLVEACANFLSIATSHSERHPIITFLVGQRWTRRQQAVSDIALRRVSAERVAFARLMRAELGKDAVEFAFEQAEKENAQRAKIEKDGRSSKNAEVGDDGTDGPSDKKSENDQLVDSELGCSAISKEVR